MLINIFNEKSEQKYKFDIDEENTLNQLYQKLCQQDKSITKQGIILLNDKMLKWEQTIQELKVFYNFDENSILHIRCIEENTVKPNKVESSQQNHVQKSDNNNQNPVLSVHQYNLIKKAFQLKSQDWHHGYLDSEYPKSNTPQPETIFANRYQIICPIVDKHITNVHKALDLSEQRIVYLFTGVKNLVDYAPPINFTHRYFLKTYDVGEFESYTYSTVEYLEGKFLQEVIVSNNFAIKTIIDLLIDLAKIIMHLHEQGHTHGNLNTRNILITPENKIFLLKNSLIYKLSSVENKNKRTKQDIEFNMPVYFSPETYYHQKQSVPSDIFSFGTIAYHLLTKVSPFGFHKDTLLNEEHIPINIINPKIPENLARLVSSMLESEIEVRPENMEIVFEELASIRCVLDSNQLQFQLTQFGANESFWESASILLNYSGSETYQSMVNNIFSNHQPKNKQEEAYLAIITGSLKANPQIFEMIASLSESSIRECYILTLLQQTTIPEKLLCLVSREKLLEFLQYEYLTPDSQLQILTHLQNIPIEEVFFYLTKAIDKLNSAKVKSTVFAIFDKNKFKIVPALFVFLFSSEKKRIKLAQEILTFLGFESLSDAIIKLKKGDDQMWKETIKKLDENPQFYQTILCAFTLLLKDKNRNIRWLAGNALFMAEKSKALHLLLVFLKEQHLIYEMLQVMNFAGSNVAFTITSHLQGVLDKQLLQYMWHIRWNTNDENRIKTCQILGQNKTARSIIFLIETLFSSNRSLSKEAEKSIMQIGVSVIGELIPFLADKDMKRFVLNIFTSFGQHALPPLVSFFEKTNSIPEKKSIIKILGKIGGEEAICAILPYLGSSHKSIYHIVKEEMIHLGNQCEEWLLPALKGTSLVRARSQEILVHINPKSVFQSLIDDIEQNNITLSKQSVKLISEVSLDIIADDIKKIKSSLLYKLYYFSKQQKIRSYIDQLLADDQIFTEIKKLLVCEPFNPELFTDSRCVPILISILLDTNATTSIIAAQILAKNFPEKSTTYLVSAWYQYWQQHLNECFLSGKLNIHDLQIIDIPQAQMIEKYLVNIGEAVTPHLLELLPSMAILAGIEATILISKIPGNNRIAALEKIQKNKSLSSLWRQTAHITLCLIQGNFDLITQVMQQQKNAFICRIAEKILANFLNQISPQCQKCLNTLFDLQTKDSIANIIILIFEKSKDIKSISPFLQNFSQKQKETLVPILLKNLQHEERKVIMMSVQVLMFLPDPSTLNALQVLLSRIPNTDEELTSLIKKAIHKITQQSAKE